MRERFGAGLVVDVLRGAKNLRVRELRLDKLSTFGISEKSKQELMDIINYLIEADYLHKTNEQYPVIKLGAKAALALQPEAKIFMKVSADGRLQLGGRKENPDLEVVPFVKTSAKVSAGVIADKGLFESLKALRMEIARENGLPAFVIFHDSTLMAMCAKMPANISELLEVPGVGQVKAARYGQAFLDAIAKFAD
jgi:ATP-dependent DNA helicase RecQ